MNSSRIGFTTMTFKPALQRGEIDVPTLLRWGAAKGFDWCELRDFSLELSPTDVAELHRCAANLGLHLHYAWDSTSLARSEPDRFRYAIANAGLGGPGALARVVIAPERVDATQGTYPVEERADMLRALSDLIGLAWEAGVTVAFENATESLAEFESLCSALPLFRLTLDPANAFAAARTAGQSLTGANLLDFVVRHRDRIPYVHLKSSLHGSVQPDLLRECDYPLDGLLAALAPDCWLCVELPARGDTESSCARVDAGRREVARWLKGRAALGL